MASLNLSKLLTPDLAKLIMASAAPAASSSFRDNVIVGQVRPAFSSPVASAVTAPIVAKTPDIVAGVNYDPNMTMPPDDGGISRKTLIIGGAAALAIVGAIVVVKLKRKKR